VSHPGAAADFLALSVVSRAVGFLSVWLALARVGPADRSASVVAIVAAHLATDDFAQALGAGRDG
jgi:hypothetical protein